MDDVMFSLKSKELVVKLVDIRDQLKNRKVMVVTDFAEESQDISVEDEKQSSWKQDLLNIGTYKEVCEVRKTVSCADVFHLANTRSSSKVTDIPRATANNNTDSRITNHCDLHEKELHLENKTIERDTERLVGGKGFVCAWCKKVLSSKSVLHKHQQCFHREANIKSNEKQALMKKQTYPVDISEKNLSPTSLKVHKETEHALGIEKRIYSCDKCEKRFSVKRTLKVHMSIHESKRHTCHICGKAFTQKGNLVNHVQLHGEERPFSCTLCPSKFKIKKDLSRHQVKHSQELNYSCNKCDKKFKYRSILNDHVWSHINPNRFSCDICGYGCTNKSTFRTHKQTHDHSQKFPCNFCGKEFFQKSLLRSHKTYVHSTETYECMECGKTFAAKQYLRNHMKTHSQLSFQCVCGKTYRNKISLRDHIVLKKH